MFGFKCEVVFFSEQRCASVAVRMFGGVIFVPRNFNRITGAADGTGNVGGLEAHLTAEFDPMPLPLL
ncbi:unnamed protein product [Gongylonema pulchrum]|uniref:Uncharacterized protein n=1 Tax=Gongylonema pulchrum TaxID=637853 RepID=A0A183EFI3_9BILA|nr:unnamed protein product [Gongylonema pulchrum]